MIRQQADQNQPRGAGGSACPITKSTYWPVLFPSTWRARMCPRSAQPSLARTHWVQVIPSSRCQFDQLNSLKLLSPGDALICVNRC